MISVGALSLVSSNGVDCRNGDCEEAGARGDTGSYVPTIGASRHTEQSP